MKPVRTATGIAILVGHSEGPTSISEESILLKSLVKPINIKRIYVDKEFASAARGIVSRFLREEEEKGIELGFSYGLHFYGPYSAELDAETAMLSTEGVLSFDYSGYSHRIILLQT